MCYNDEKPEEYVSTISEANPLLTLWLKPGDTNVTSTITRVHLLFSSLLRRVLNTPAPSECTDESDVLDTFYERLRELLEDARRKL